VARDDLDGEWQGTCKVRLWVFAGSARPAESVLLLQFRTVRPQQKRLGKPGWLLACSVEQVGAGIAKGFLFRERGADRGLEPERLYDNWNEELKLSHTGQIYACDYNRDGCIDLLVTDLRFPGVALFEGTPNGDFRDVARETGLLTDAGRPAEGFTGQA